MVFLFRCNAQRHMDWCIPSPRHRCHVLNYCGEIVKPSRKVLAVVLPMTSVCSHNIIFHTMSLGVLLKSTLILALTKQVALTSHQAGGCRKTAECHEGCAPYEPNLTNHC